MKSSKTNTLTLDNVEKVAKLAKLNLKTEEKEKFLKQLSSILEYVGKLTEVDTKSVEETAQVTGLKNVYREDKVEPSLPQDVVLSQAKATHNGYFKVDAVLEE